MKNKVIIAIGLCCAVFALAQSSMETLKTVATRIDTKRVLRTIELNYTPDGKFADAMVYLAVIEVSTNDNAVLSSAPQPGRQLDRKWFDATQSGRDTLKSLDALSGTLYGAAKEKP